MKLRNRKELTGTENLEELVVTMCEGNPGGLRVMMDIVKQLGQTKAMMKILQLDDMNIRGDQIWIGYKDWAKEYIFTFIEGITNRDPKMVKIVNRGINNSVLPEDREVAVVAGASKERYPNGR